MKRPLLVLCVFLIALFVARERYGSPKDPPLVLPSEETLLLSGKVYYIETKLQYGETISTFYLSSATILPQELANTSQTKLPHST
ncbi:MAG: hypothetical protein LBM60_08905, partial [Clostridium sp.]|nr:hypothetical protein [Clostridium sp.]